MRKRAREAALQDVGKVIRSGIEVELYRPLGTHEIERIHEAALTVLERVGMGDGIPILYELAANKGCEITEEGRIKFPRALVEDVIAGACRSFVFHGREPEHDLEIGGNRVHFGTAGAAVSVPDFGTGRYRPSTLHDIYDFGRLVDRLPNLAWYSRTVVPAEIEDWTAMDLNMAYATAASTTKAIGVSFNEAGNVAPVIEMFDMMLGGEGRFARRPFCKVHSTAIVPPLKFAPENSEVNVAAARNRMPVNLIIAAQAGATSPASLAGTLVQTTAEALGGLVLINLVRPGHPVIFSNWPFTSDLRTGAFSARRTGGGAAQCRCGADCQLVRTALRRRRGNDRLQGARQPGRLRKGDHEPAGGDERGQLRLRVGRHAGRAAGLLVRGPCHRQRDDGQHPAGAARHRGDGGYALGAGDRAGGGRPGAFPRARADAQSHADRVPLPGSSGIETRRRCGRRTAAATSSSVPTSGCARFSPPTTRRR